MARTLPVPPRLWRTAQPDEATWLASAVDLLDLVARELGVDDLEGMRLLDMGCGTKFTKAIVEQDLPIGRYVGIDTSADVIDHLQRHVDDARFEFHHLDVYNELYNTEGVPLDRIEALPVDDERFDAICLFSVFTHLAPPDYVAMLRLLRPAVRPGGRLVFSLFVDHGGSARARDERFAAELERRLRSDDPDVVAATEAALVEQLASAPPVPDFVDAHPHKPLMWPTYSERYARELIDGTGWRPLALHPPGPYIQHWFTCEPV